MQIPAVMHLCNLFIALYNLCMMARSTIAICALQMRDMSICALLQRHSHQGHAGLPKEHVHTRAAPRRGLH